tara:strand:- start:58 stop:294 length:237 start_codon:yes stop_codon:yes gene_type:complete
MSQRINDINQVEKETSNFFKSTYHWSDFDVLSIVEGILRSCFKMIFQLAPSKKVGIETIMAILSMVSDECVCEESEVK